ncbi:MAG: hypothetical protein PHX57_10600, partial [Desulfobulbaceae bacterium]|nr:hypothetical protein [Desulfobulbaceae bacterium]
DFDPDTGFDEIFSAIVLVNWHPSGSNPVSGRAGKGINSPVQHNLAARREAHVLFIRIPHSAF